MYIFKVCDPFWINFYCIRCDVRLSFIFWPVSVQSLQYHLLKGYLPPWNCFYVFVKNNFIIWSQTSTVLWRRNARLTEPNIVCVPSVSSSLSTQKFPLRSWDDGWGGLCTRRAYHRGNVMDKSSVIILTNRKLTFQMYAEPSQQVSWDHFSKPEPLLWTSFQSPDNWRMSVSLLTELPGF